MSWEGRPRTSVSVRWVRLSGASTILRPQSDKGLAIRLWDTLESVSGGCGRWRILKAVLNQVPGVGVTGAEELAVRKRRMVTGDGVGRCRIGFGEEVGVFEWGDGWWGVVEVQWILVEFAR